MSTVTAPHWPGVPASATTVVTEHLRLTQLAIDQSSHLRQPALVVGPPGSGKTFAITLALNSLGPAWVRYRADHTPVGNALLLSCLQLLGEPVPQRVQDRTQENLSALLAQVLTDRPHVLWVDEAQNLSRKALRQLRHVVDTPGIQSTLVLSGEKSTIGLLRKHERPLLSRVARTVGFELLDPDTTLVPTLRAYHPLYAETQGRVLRSLDERRCRGSFREYAKVLEFVASTFPGAGRIEQEMLTPIRTALGYW